MFDTEILHADPVAECTLEGKNIFTYDRNDKVAAAFIDLTKEVVQLEHRLKNRSRVDDKGLSGLDELFEDGSEASWHSCHYFVRD